MRRRTVCALRNEQGVPLVNEQGVPLVNEQGVPLVNEQGVPLVKDGRTRPISYLLSPIS